jgi:hypothetical protein
VVIPQFFHTEPDLAGCRDILAATRSRGEGVGVGSHPLGSPAGSSPRLSNGRRCLANVYVVAAGIGTQTVKRNGATSAVTISGPPNLHEMAASDESAPAVGSGPIKGRKSFR